tara:strand:+ start:1834 stop:2175 length:342 start_codon:yes stop_codon:yes gene_type:complete
MKKLRLHKNLEHMDYYKIVDYYVNQYHYDKMIAVLYDLSYHFNQLEVEEAEKQIERLGLSELGLDAVIESDVIIMEFDTMNDMEEYMYRTEYEGVWIKYYKYGELYEEYEADM